MIDGIRLYLRYIGVSLRGQMQYRASFVMLSFGHFLVTGIEFLGIIVLFDRFGSLREWTLPEVALLYGLVNIAFSISDAISRGFDDVGGMIRRGDFDRLLLRPRSTVLQLVGYELTMRRVGRLTQGLAVFIWASVALDVVWSPAKLLLTMGTVAGGVCLFLGLFVLQGTMAFWTTETLEIMNTMTYGGVETAQYPLSIYRTWFRWFFTIIVPLACVNYFPALAILERADPLGTPLFFQWMAPAVGVIFLVVTLQVWKIGIRHYRSTGS